MSAGRLPVALALLLLGPSASAGAQARQTYVDLFTTDVPGASTGRSYAIDYFRPDDREAKPHAFSRLRVELAEGARFDTSAIPQCRASDAELVAQGRGACPADSVVGVDETVVDTGFPGPSRHFTTDFTFFNNRDELILLAAAREYGARVVVRGRIAGNVLEIDNPMIPGTPPDGAAARSQRGTFYPRSARRDGRELHYLTTPPTCPSTGHWVNRVVYTYRDGVKQTAESRTPCRPPGAAAGGQGRRRPVIRAEGVPRRCVRRAFRARVRVDAAVRSVRVTLAGRTLASARSERLSVRVPARRLRPGRHALRVVVVAADGERQRRSFRFRRCRR